MANAIDWSECPLVEIVPGKVSGAPLLKNPGCPYRRSPGTMMRSAIGGFRRMKRLRKRWTVIRKLAWTPSRSFFAIGPSISCRRNLESVF